MSKKSQAETPVTEATVSTETVVAPPEAPIEVPPEATEVLTSPAAAIEVVDDGRTLAHLVPRLPHLKRVLTRFHRPTLDEIDDAVARLAPEKSKAFTEVMERLNPIKPGVFLARKRTMTPQDIKIYQGIGNDDMRPQMVPVGGVYTRDGRILAVPNNFANVIKAPQSVRAIVISIYEGQSFWPSRGDDGKGRVPPGEHPFEKIPFSMVSERPYCRSLDQVRGDVFGDCASCTYRPFAERGVPNDCKTDMQLYVVLADFTGLYRILLTGRSVGNAGKSIAKWMNNWSNPWARVFEFEAVAKTGEKNSSNRWFEWQVRLAVSQEYPEGIPTTEEEKKLFQLLSNQVSAELYFPNLVNLYNQSFRSKGGIEGGGEKKASSLNDVSDLNAAIASAEAAATKNPEAVDYSTNNL